MSFVELKSEIKYFVQHLFIATLLCSYYKFEASADNVPFSLGPAMLSKYHLFHSLCHIVSLLHINLYTTHSMLCCSQSEFLIMCSLSSPPLAIRLFLIYPPDFNLNYSDTLQGACLVMVLLKLYDHFLFLSLHHKTKNEWRIQPELSKESLLPFNYPKPTLSILFAEC